MEYKTAKSKKVANHYIPPPARKLGQEPNETSRIKERPTKTVVNKEKLCNDSSLLFKDSSNKPKDKSKRKRKSKNDGEKANAENFPNVIGIDNKISELNENDHKNNSYLNKLENNLSFPSPMPCLVDIENKSSEMPTNQCVDLGTRLENMKIENSITKTNIVTASICNPESLAPDRNNEESEKQNNNGLTEINVPTGDNSGDLRLEFGVPNNGEDLTPIVASNNSHSIQSEENTIDDSDWYTLYDDRGDCLIPDVVNPLSHQSSQVSKQVAKQKLVKADLVKSDCDDQQQDTTSIIEIYGFSEDLKTNDLMNIFSNFVHRGFTLKWVDNTHALGIFPSPTLAAEVLSSNLPFVQTRPICQATLLSQDKARTLVLPSSLRPKTCTALARRLVSGALGLKVNVTPEERAAEKELLREAREKKKLVLKQRDAAWEGNYASLDNW